MKILKDFDHKVKVFLRSVDVNECLASNLSPPANFLSCKYFDSLLINFVVESYVNLALSAKIIVIINWSENARTLLIEEFLVNKANKNYVIFEATQTINQHFQDNNMLFKFWCLHFCPVFCFILKWRRSFLINHLPLFIKVLTKNKKGLVLLL